jgi:SAM-dependent methyltransferase
VKYGDNRDVKIEIKEQKDYREKIKSTIKVFADKFPPPLKVLDIGARDGYGTGTLKKYGYDAVGIEIVQGFVDHAVGRGRNVRWGDAMNLEFEPKSFDVIYSRHCIEHCKDTVKFFSECEKVLKPEGCVFITFPFELRDKWLSRKYPGLNHMVYFETKDQFREVVEKTNFKEILFTKSKSLGIVPDKIEYLFIGKLNG